MSAMEGAVEATARAIYGRSRRGRDERLIGARQVVDAVYPFIAAAVLAEVEPVDVWPVCPSCSRTIGTDAAPGARGLCKGCYRIELRRTGRLGRSADHVADEYRAMRDNGWSASAVPELLGMSGAAFERAMYRLRLAGDPRVSDWQRQPIHH